MMLLNVLRQLLHDTISMYNGGNTILTTDNRDIAFTLAQTTTNSKFSVTTANGSTAYSQFALGAGSNTNVPNQLVLVDNQNVIQYFLPAGIKITSSGGGTITNGIDLSDSAISTAILFGTNNITGTNFSITGSSGNVTSAGNVAVNGGSLLATTAVSGNLI